MGEEDKQQLAISDQPEPKKLVRFRANEKSPTIDIQEGEYRRSFRAEDQPFEVENENELQMLRATGRFVEDKEAEKEAEAEATDDGKPATVETKSKAQSPKSKVGK